MKGKIHLIAMLQQQRKDGLRKNQRMFLLKKTQRWREKTRYNHTPSNIKPQVKDFLYRIFRVFSFCRTYFSRDFYFAIFSVILEKLICLSAKSHQCISRASKDCQSQVGRVRGIATEYRMVNGKISTTYRLPLIYRWTIEYTVDMSVEYRPREI